MNENTLLNGIRVFEKHPNAPDFVIASIVITLSDLLKFAKDNPNLLTEYKGQKQLRAQLLRSKQGKLYIVADTYKKADPGAYVAPAIEVVTEDELPF